MEGKTGFGWDRGNRFSLFFEKGKRQVFDNWKTPAAFDYETWNLDSRSGTAVTCPRKWDS
jgi:hypothetical protein